MGVGEGEREKGVRNGVEGDGGGGGRGRKRKLGRGGIGARGGRWRGEGYRRGLNLNIFNSLPRFFDLQIKQTHASACRRQMMIFLGIKDIAHGYCDITAADEAQGFLMICARAYCNAHYRRG